MSTCHSCFVVKKLEKRLRNEAEPDGWVDRLLLHDGEVLQVTLRAVVDGVRLVPVGGMLSQLRIGRREPHADEDSRPVGRAGSNGIEASRRHAATRRYQTWKVSKYRLTIASG